MLAELEESMRGNGTLTVGVHEIAIILLGHHLSLLELIVGDQVVFLFHVHLARVATTLSQSIDQVVLIRARQESNLWFLVMALG